MIARTVGPKICQKFLIFHYTCIDFCEYYDELQDWIKPERPENRNYAHLTGTTDICILLTDDEERTNSETGFCTQKEALE